MRRLIVVLTLTVGMVLALGGTAFAAKPTKGVGGGHSSSTGYDVSYPQCGGTLPSSPAFGIVGVNDGIVYSPNPCLGKEYAWATSATSTTQPKVSFYANTADPGPSLSSYWPTGQTSPETCSATSSDSTACSYDYGWNAAANSFADAASAAGSTAAAVASPWWLDVETANSWETNTANNDADIQGALDYLKTQGVPSAGIYTNGTSFKTVMGSTNTFAGYPSWVPGARTLRGAEANCTASITGGAVTYAQYPSGGFDADYACA